jgi:hypothetical protein
MADARRIEAELTKLVVEADHDYPILVELKHLPAAPIQSKATAALLIR